MITFNQTAMITFNQTAAIIFNQTAVITFNQTAVIIFNQTAAIIFNQTVAITFNQTAAIIFNQTVAITFNQSAVITFNQTFSPFSPFAAVSLFGVAGLAETFPSFSVSGPFLLDVPGFQIPSDSIVPPQLWSSSRALPLHLHFCNCSNVFSFTSSFDVSKPFQPSPSHNRRYRFHLCFFKISFLRCSNRFTPIAHRTIRISVVRFSSLTDIGHVSHP